MDKINQLHGKEAWSCMAVAGILCTNMDNLQGEQFIYNLAAICLLCALGTVARIVSKWVGEK